MPEFLLSQESTTLGTEALQINMSLGLVMQYCLIFIIFVCKFYTTLCRSFWILDTVWFLIPTQLVKLGKLLVKFF